MSFLRLFVSCCFIHDKKTLSAYSVNVLASFVGSMCTTAAPSNTLQSKMYKGYVDVFPPSNESKSDFFVGRRSFPWSKVAKGGSHGKRIPVDHHLDNLLAMYKLLKLLQSLFKLVTCCLVLETPLEN